MQSALRKALLRLQIAASSRLFFHICVGLFALSALWVATISLYPMAFDEDFHLGLIKIYSQHLLPFGITDSPEMATYGAATHDPSYLFQYLMSFPYRAFSWLGFGQTTSVILLRFINIGLMVTALYWFRKTLRSLKLPSLSSNLVLILFMLIPIMPLVAGQINYDNLLLLATALSAYFAVRIAAQIRENTAISPHYVFGFMIVGLVGSATKFAFLPIALALVIYVLGTLVLTHRKTSWQIIRRFFGNCRKLKSWQLGLLLIGLLIALLANGKYVENVATFHRFEPDCAQIFDEKGCQNYGPWGRNNILKQNLDESFSPKSFPAYFFEDWLTGMTFRLFFSVAGSTNDFATRDPLPVIIVSYIVIAIIGCGAFIVSGRRVLRRNPQWWIAVGFVVFYIVPLTLKLYGSYKATGEPIAINGRYLLPVLPFVGGLLLLSLQRSVFKLPSYLKTLIATVFIVLLVLQGGGITTYIIRGESSWFFDGWGEQSHAAAKAALEPITLR